MHSRSHSSPTEASLHKIAQTFLSFVASPAATFSVPAKKFQSDTSRSLWSLHLLSFNFNKTHKKVQNCFETSSDVKPAAEAIAARNHFLHANCDYCNGFTQFILMTTNAKSHNHFKGFHGLTPRISATGRSAGAAALWFKTRGSQEIWEKRS